MRKRFAGVGIGALLATGLVFAAASGGSFTTINAESHSVEGGQPFTTSIGKNDAIGRDLSGRIKLVATGTTVKTATIGSTGYWNFKMWWDDSPSGSAYRVTKVTSWNAGAQSVTDGQVWWPNGHTVGTGLIYAGNTWQNLYIGTGSSTTKMEQFTIPSDGCIYLTPGGGTWHPGVDCSA